MPNILPRISIVICSKMSTIITQTLQLLIFNIIVVERMILVVAFSKLIVFHKKK